MTIQEKAKAYDEALERAKKLKENPEQVFYEFSPKEGDTICDYIFPELKESEDEKIRKELLDYCKNKAEKYPNDPKYQNISAWIAWLEKQGKQKSTWSEKDEQYLLVCKNALKKYEVSDKWDSNIIIRWLENRLKEKNLFLHNNKGD
jgi:hypothetical protein